MLAVISGDGQQGEPGAALTQPLVVEVRDQYGDLLPEATVAFTVTAGEGQLSDRFTVEHITTDADGRAELTLTLGLPGPNIVGVSLGGRELGTFTAEGVGHGGGGAGRGTTGPGICPRQRRCVWERAPWEKATGR